MSNKIINNLLTYDYGYEFGFNFKTDISQTIGGNEQRRARWDKPLRKYAIPYNNKYITDLKKMWQFIYAHRGAYESFLFFDNNSRMTWVVEDGFKVISVGAVDKIYLPVKYLNKKAYSFNNFPEEYPSVGFTLNLTEDVIIKVDNVQRTTNTTINSTTGEITFTASKPVSSSVITVEYAYYTKVRASDNFKITENNYNLGGTSLELTEVR